MEQWFLVRQYLWEVLEQEDVVYCVLKFYVPLFNETIERALIERLVRDKYRDRILLRKTLTNKHMLLDPRLRNDRFEKLFLHLEKRWDIPYTKKWVNSF